MENMVRITTTRTTQEILAELKSSYAGELILMLFQTLNSDFWSFSPRLPNLLLGEYLVSQGYTVDCFNHDRFFITRIAP